MKYLFLDTNIYLHYKDFEQIDWKSLLEDSDDFTVIVPQKIIREIDKQKDQGKDKIKDRAKKISSKFAKLFLDEKSCQVKIQKCNDPSEHDFDGKIFDHLIDDDWILLSAIHSGFDMSDIIMVSADNNLLIKAKENNLKYLKLPEEYKLQEELSGNEKEIKSLKAELGKYKNRSSKPSITFLNGQDRLEFVKPTEIKLDDELFKYVNQLKKDNPHKEYKEVDYSSVFGLWEIGIDTERINEYNKKLDDYFEACKDYESFRKLNDILEERFKEISFEIHNDGTDQTGDMNIYIKFPEIIKLYNRTSKKSRKARFPIKPLLQLDRMYLDINIDDVLPQRTTQICWDLEKTLDEKIFNFQEPKLNHCGLFRELEIDDSLYIDINTCGNFEIEWIIVDSKLSNPITGKLHIVVK